jgi:lysophospholipase L1-like esterase
MSFEQITNLQKKLPEDALQPLCDPVLKISFVHLNMKFRTLLFFLAVSCSSFAQHDTLLAQCRLRDTIWFSQNLKPVFAKMNRSKNQAYKTVTRVVQIGDSHVQMGYFSATVGLQLNSLYGKAVLNSFWFPYAETGGFNPVGVGFNHHGDWKGEKMVGSTGEKRFGISGHALVLESNGEGDPHLNITQAMKISKFEVLLETNKTWRFCLDSATVTTKKVSGHLTLVTIVPWRHLYSLKLKFCANSEQTVPLRIFGFRNASVPVRQGIDFQYYGSSGSKYFDYINNAAYFMENLAWLDPDLLVISLGTNDSYAELSASGYHTMVSNFIIQTKRANPGVNILMTMPPDLYFKNTKPPSAPVVFSTLFKIAQEQRCALWNFAEVMGGSDSMQIWCKMGLASNDLMHLNPQGYDIQGTLLAEAINHAYHKYYK